MEGVGWKFEGFGRGLDGVEWVGRGWVGWRRKLTCSTACERDETSLQFVASVVR